LPIELHAATTEGSSIHIGIIYFLLLITIWGITDNGSASFPMTFYIIVSANYKLKPPDWTATLSNYLSNLLFTISNLSLTDNL
jgi:hypothetical protein